MPKRKSKSMPLGVEATRRIRDEKESKTGIIDLSSCGLEFIPDALLSLTHLHTVNLRYNGLSSLTGVSSLKKLVNLDLGANSIADVSDLVDLTKLRRLDLSDNHISDFSPLKALLELTDLDLRNNYLTDLSFIEVLVRLETLYLMTGEITDIECISALQKLKKLYLNRNMINDAEPLSTLSKLEVLDLRSNNISDISFLTGLSKLKKIYLDDNQISHIEPIVPLVKSGLTVGQSFSNDIWIERNPIVDIPKSILLKGRKSILEWFNQLDSQGKAPLYEAKLMILGQGGAGKTTFVRLQFNEDYIVKKGKLDATLGIEIHKGKEFDHSERKQKIKANLWDFGGQNIQKMLHQFFITEDCLYVLVSDKRKENANFDYWFQIINLLGPKCPVIVLENEMDSKGNNESFAINRYQSFFPDIDINVRDVNLRLIKRKTKKDWEYLNSTIAKKLSQLDIVNRNVPRKWTLIRNRLTSLYRKKYITTQTYYEFCDEADIGLNEEQAGLCLRYLNSLGDLVHFNEGELSTYIFLNHKWLTEGLYYILADKEIQNQQGKFTREQAYKKWGRKYSRHEKDMLLLLLLKDQFDLCYELTQKGNFITPLLLPNDKPGNWDYETNLHFQYNYGFMPHGIFSRAIVRIHEKIEGDQRWQTGVRLYDRETGARAEVQQFNDPDDNRQVIDIKITGSQPSCKLLLNFIRKNVEPLHREFKNLNVKEMVGCNCSTCEQRMKAGDKPTFYEFNKLERNLENGRYHVDCDHNFKKPINIGYILSDVVAEDAGKKYWGQKFMEELKGVGMTIDRSDRSINISDIGKAYAKSSSNAKSESKSESKSKSKSKAKFNIQIQNLRGDTEVLKEDIERELKIKNVSEEDIALAVSDVESAENALEQMESAESIEAVPAKSKSRLRRFINSLSNPDSTMHKTLKMLREGKDHGVQLAETYNKIAGNFGMPLVPPAALEVIKSI